MNDQPPVVTGNSDHTVPPTVTFYPANAGYPADTSGVLRLAGTESVTDAGAGSRTPPEVRFDPPCAAGPGTPGGTGHGQ
jgi:hypothetical protein